MPRCFKLSPNASAHPADVVAAKLILRGLGHYEAPSWGISEYPDRDLFDAIKDFQAKQGLKADGVINHDGETVQALAQRIQAMGRNGDTILAHINPAEAQLLDRVTDGGSINPLTGMLEFYHDFDDGYDGTLDNDEDYSGYSSGGDFDDGYASSGNIGGPDGSGETNDHGSNENGGNGNVGPGAADGALSTTTDNVAKDPDQNGNQNQTSGPTTSQKAHMALQLNQDPEKEDGIFAKSAKPQSKPSSKPAPPKEEFSLWGSFVEDLSSIFTGKTKTGENRGAHSAYDTRAAKGMARAADPSIDLESPEGKALVESFQRGGNFGPGSVPYNADVFHDAQLGQLAQETAQTFSAQHSSGAQNQADQDRKGRQAAVSIAAGLAGYSMDEQGNVYDEGGKFVGNAYGNDAVTLAGGSRFGLYSDPSNPGAIYRGLEWTWDKAADIYDRFNNPKRNQYDHPRNNTMTDEELEEFQDGALDYAGTRTLGGAASIGGMSLVVPEPLRSGLGIAGDLINQEADRKKKNLLK